MPIVIVRPSHWDSRRRVRSRDYPRRRLELRIRLIRAVAQSNLRRVKSILAENFYCDIGIFDDDFFDKILDVANEAGNMFIIRLLVAHFHTC
jgi:hypothetical protein